MRPSGHWTAPGRSHRGPEDCLQKRGRLAVGGFETRAGLSLEERDPHTEAEDRTLFHDETLSSQSQRPCHNGADSTSSTQQRGKTHT